MDNASAKARSLPPLDLVYEASLAARTYAQFASRFPYFAALFQLAGGHVAQLVGQNPAFYSLVEDWLRGARIFHVTLGSSQDEISCQAKGCESQVRYEALALPAIGSGKKAGLMVGRSPIITTD